MYAYIDETGNTGPNIFDLEQPVFTYGALVTKTNFDLIHRRTFRALAKRVGVTSLHASEMGAERIEAVARELRRVVREADARFYISRAVKSDVAATKFVDAIFDSGENLAVPWHTYNFRPLRLLLTVNVAFLLDHELKRRFWSALMSRSGAASRMLLVSTLQDFLPRIDRLPDRRSQQLIREAVSWAIENPKSLYVHATSKALRYGHLPNIAIFPDLLWGIELQSQKWDLAVREIKHDRQQQFGTTLKYWHELSSTAPPDSLYLPGGETYSFRRVPGSAFQITSHEDSPGIQLADLVLWVLQRLENRMPLGPETARFLRSVADKTSVSELSLASIREYLSEVFAKVDSAPLSEEELRRARKLLDEAETRRRRAIEDYARQKVKETAA